MVGNLGIDHGDNQHHGGDYADLSLSRKDFWAVQNCFKNIMQFIDGLTYLLHPEDIALSFIVYVSTLALQTLYREIKILEAD